MDDKILCYLIHVTMGTYMIYGFIFRCYNISSRGPSRLIYRGVGRLKKSAPPPQKLISPYTLKFINSNLEIILVSHITIDCIFLVKLNAPPHPFSQGSSYRWDK